MLRILLIFLLALIGFKIIRNLRRSFVPRHPRETSQRAVGEPKELIACARCGTFVLKSNALRSNSDYYCSETCRNS